MVDALISSVFWLTLLYVLSCFSLYASPERQKLYNELIGCLILLALFTTFISPMVDSVAPADSVGP